MGNRVRPGEEPVLREFVASLDADLLAAIPEDPAVGSADREGRCLLDVAPDSPATLAIQQLADDLEDRYLTRVPVPE